MCKQAQIEKEEQRKLMNEADIRTNLQSLQTWDAQEDEALKTERETYRETLIQGQKKENQTLRADAQRQVPPVRAAAAAHGTPVQEQVPAKLSYKQRRELKRKAKLARKHTAAGTAESYDLQTALSSLLQERNNSTASYRADLQKELDEARAQVAKAWDEKAWNRTRLIEEYEAKQKTYLEREAIAAAKQKKLETLMQAEAFCSGYRMDRKGRPATKEDQARKEQDQALIEAYISGDVEQRRPYLEKFKNELMTFNVTEDTLSDAYILKNAARLKQITDRVAYYEKMMKDPDNAAYFDGLPTGETAVLKRRMTLLGQVGGYFAGKTNLYSVDSNTGNYMPLAIEGQHGMTAEFRRLARESMATLDEDCQELVKPSLAQMVDQIRDRVVDGLRARTDEKHVSRGTDIQFAQDSFEPIQERLRALREQIVSEPERYAEHREVIDALYQDAYRTLDIMNDLNIEGMAYYTVFRNLKSDTLYHRIQTTAASREAAECQARAKKCRWRANEISEALNYLLKGGAVSGDAQDLIEETKAKLAEQKAGGADPDGGDAHRE